jgi:predicted transcriptional regulator
MNLDKVKKVIVEKGLKKSFVAKKIGVTNVWFSYYLNGKRSLSLEKENKLKEFLEL